VFDFTTKIQGHFLPVSLNRLDKIKEGCILGSKFFAKENPICIDTEKKMFRCTINGRIISCPLFTESMRKCYVLEQPHKVVKTPLVDLAKIERCITYADIHKDKALVEMTAKIEKDYTSENPNVFWKREKYFVSLHFDPSIKSISQKASVVVMSPSKRDFCAKEIK